MAALSKGQGAGKQSCAHRTLSDSWESLRIVWGLRWPSVSAPASPGLSSPSHVDTSVSGTPAGAWALPAHTSYNHLPRSQHPASVYRSRSVSRQSNSGNAATRADPTPTVLFPALHMDQASGVSAGPAARVSASRLLDGGTRTALARETLEPRVGCRGRRPYGLCLFCTSASTVR